MIHELLYATLGSLVESRYYPGTFAQSDGGVPTWPAIRGVIVSADPFGTVCGTDDGSTDNVRVQLDIVALRYDDMAALKADVIAALEVTDPPCTRQPGGFETFDEPTRTHRAVLDYLVHPSSSPFDAAAASVAGGAASASAGGGSIAAASASAAAGVASAAAGEDEAIRTVSAQGVGIYLNSAWHTTPYVAGSSHTVCIHVDDNLGPRNIDPCPNFPINGRETPTPLARCEVVVDPLFAARDVFRITGYPTDNSGDNAPRVEFYTGTNDGYVAHTGVTVCRGFGFLLPIGFNALGNQQNIHWLVLSQLHQGDDSGSEEPFNSSGGPMSYAMCSGQVGNPGQAKLELVFTVATDWPWTIANSSIVRIPLVGGGNVVEPSAPTEGVWHYIYGLETYDPTGGTGAIEVWHAVDDGVAPASWMNCLPRTVRPMGTVHNHMNGPNTAFMKDGDYHFRIDDAEVDLTPRGGKLVIHRTQTMMWKNDTKDKFHVLSELRRGRDGAVMA